MSETRRLRSVADVSGDVTLPEYDPSSHGCGIVHLGVGAFHKAHQAVYTDTALALDGGDWRIVGVSLRSTDAADALNPQNGLYTLLTRDAEGTKARIIGSIDHVIAAPAQPAGAVLSALIDPMVRIVTLTVTEKAYGIDRAILKVDAAHPSIAGDLEHPQDPKGVIGLLVESLRLRRSNELEPFTVLCCDNLPENGALLKAGVVDFAKRLDPELATWISQNVAFPSSMVDRITPATTQNTFDDACALIGCEDVAAVETEPFSQWVVEDTFPQGRPAWEKGGALFVSDVAPYEKMKLRMLNGAHSMLAYAGFVAGHTYVRDVMQDPHLSALVKRHLGAAAKTLPDLPGVDLDQYATDLAERFANPSMAHETYQIAMDGTEKLPQRIIAPALEQTKLGDDVHPFAFAIAAWMRYCLGVDETGTTYTLRDPMEGRISAALRDAKLPREISAALHGLSGLFPQELAMNRDWRDAVETALSYILKHGMQAAIAHEAARIAGVSRQ